MAHPANAVICIKHKFTRIGNIVIGMAGCAFGHVHILKSLEVGALTKEVFGRSVAETADKMNTFDPGRNSAVVSVTVVARRSRHIAFFTKKFIMHACFIEFDLIGRYIVRLHILRVRMAISAGFTDMKRVDF